VSRYVLVHGAWHGSWCWDEVVRLLEAKGHTAEAPDLPGLGRDATPLPEISLRAHTDRVCAVLGARPEPAVLVGHSLGGIVITQAAEQCPERVRTLVYLAAFLPRDGESLLQLSEAGGGMVGPNLVLSDDRRSATVRAEAIREAFYGDCSAVDAARATSLLVPEATAPMGTPVHTTAENFGRIPRDYIECLRDRAIPPPLQRQMYTTVPCREVISMDTSHSPFLSASQELADHLDRIGAGRPSGQHPAAS
jgi:pimeloyl-ACP methyl ester carboxylesterase